MLKNEVFEKKMVFFGFDFCMLEKETQKTEN